MSSFTLTLTGNSSELSANYHPPIELNRDGEYVCGLIDFQSFMSIPNITKKNNKFCYTSEFRCQLSVEEARNAGVIIDGSSIVPPYAAREIIASRLLAIAKKLNINILDKSNISSARQESKDGSVDVVVEYYTFFTIPIGSYELADLVKYLNNTLAEKEPDSFIDIQINKNSLRSELKSNRKIVFNVQKNTIGSLFGFKDSILEPNVLHISDNVIKINSTDVIKIETNITTGAYSNDRLMRTLHEFYPSVDVGYKIVEVPRHVIYLPIAVQTIHNFFVRIVDQDNNLIDFRGETITLRVHIKRQ